MLLPIAARDRREASLSVSEQSVPVAWVSLEDGRRHACCTCSEYKIDSCCRHAWVLALLQVRLDQLELRPMPTLYLDFDPETAVMCARLS
jgi:hypothetical protein